MPKYLDIVCAEKMKERDDYNERKNQTKVYRMHSTGDRCAFDWMQSPAGWNNGDYDLSGNGTDANRCHRTARRSNRGYEPNRVCTGNGGVHNGTTHNGTTHNGAACNGTSRNGTAHNGAACNGATRDGATCDGASRNGAACNGASRNRTTRNRTTGNRTGTHGIRSGDRPGLCRRHGIR